jgi:hypothetical protein
MVVTEVEIIKALKKPLEDIYDLGKSKFSKKLAKWNADKNIKILYKKIASIQNVKTIWQIDKEVNLKYFYYPSKLIIDGARQTISNINKLPCETNVVIRGTVGQGKSIFLRYLCSQELRLGTSIPVFFELRKIQKDKSLKQLISIVLDSWGFEINDDLFDFYANSGKFIFILDGFDEIDPSLVLNVINELELFSEKYSSLKIIISSRPDSGIEKSAYFRVYDLAPLGVDDHQGILQKLIKNDEQEEIILKALRQSRTQIRELLTTPLMMTLLVLVYKAEQKIPEQFSDFYENLFQTMLLRHDKSKPGFVRAKNCQINERKLQELFEAFCFLASKESLTTINSDHIYTLAKNAIENTKIDCDTSNFIKDISKIACMIIEEGLEFHFIHKSVREYHAANFIKRRPDEFSIKFYEAMLEGKHYEWKQELDFLSQVDEYRFIKYFLIPHLEFILKINNIDFLSEYKKTTNIISNEPLYNIEVIIISDDETMFRRPQRLYYVENESYYDNCMDLINDSIRLDIKKIRSNLGVEFYAKSLIDFLDLTSDILNIINKRNQELYLLYREKCSYLQSEESKRDKFLTDL